jgi:hypothetical protein
MEGFGKVAVAAQPARPPTTCLRVIGRSAFMELVPHRVGRPIAYESLFCISEPGCFHFGSNEAELRAQHIEPRVRCHLAPLAGRGRREAPGEGDSPRVRLVESPPHPNPLPASGARGLTAAAARSSPISALLLGASRKRCVSKDDRTTAVQAAILRDASLRDASLRPPGKGLLLRMRTERMETIGSMESLV